MGNNLLFIRMITAREQLARGACAGLFFVLFFAFGEPDANAQKFCTNTAKAAFKACGFEGKDDYFTAVGKCNNEADPKSCIADAKEERQSKKEECKEQFDARKDVCDLLGEAAYNPAFDPADFVMNKAGFDNLNPYFPLKIGNKWEFEELGGDETITVEVLDKTKLIEGVTCIVVNDVVRVNGVEVENTNDSYAQALNGDVWYCGEETMEFETFAGDDPEEPELVSIDGAFKVGRDGAKPGLIMLAAPQVGDAYRQEMLLGEAEDVAEVISITGTDATFTAECMDQCLITREFTPLEPDIEANKYYALGIGPILEVENGTRIELMMFTPGP